MTIHGSFKVMELNVVCTTKKKNIYIYIYIDFQNKYLTEIKIHLQEEQNYDNLSLEQKWVFFFLKTSQVTYVTMVPRVGNETLRPLGVATGNASSVTRVWRYICKNTTCWPATAHDVTTGVSQYKCRREHTSSASSSEACVRSMAQSLGDAVSRSPLGEPWLHT